MKFRAGETKTVLPVQTFESFPNPYCFSMMAIAFKQLLRTLAGHAYNSYYGRDCECKCECEYDKCIH